MKRINLTLLAFCGLCLVSFSILFTSCMDTCQEEVTYTLYEPVYIPLDELLTDISIEAPRELRNPRKIYIYNNYIYISEYNEGIHVVNNTDPAQPVNESFIAIKGNRDIVMKGSYILADNYLDLLSIDISNPGQAIVAKRLTNVFADSYTVDSRGLVIAYNETEVTEIIDCNDAGTNDWDESWYGVTEPAILQSSNGDNLNLQPNGKGGSFARFTLYNDFLYTVGQTNLQAFNVSNPANVHLTYEDNIGFNIETIYPFAGNLFIGSQNGMFIFEVSSSTGEPNLLSEFQHWSACDPVVASGNIAYVTLRDGNFCAGFINQLDVIDISDMSNPELIRSYPMHHPMGLGIDDNLLFICEDDAGLKIYNANIPTQIDENLIKHFDEFQAYDVIPNNGILIVIGQDGLFQFDYENQEDIQLISTLPVAL